MGFSFKVGDLVSVKRKPKINEPGRDIWMPEMDPYISFPGKVTNIYEDEDISGIPFECVDVIHDDGTEYSYPNYCLIRKIVVSQIACSCKLELIITRGCKCGAFVKESKK